MSDNLILIIIIIGLFLLFGSKKITETLNSMGIKLSLSGWGGKCLHPYDGKCLTKKPYGFPSHQGMINYWKDIPKSWGKTYAETSIRGDINKVRSHTPKNSILGGSNPAPSNLKSISLGYYHDPVKYCRHNPRKYPCPNHWIKNKGSFKTSCASMNIPKLNKDYHKHTLDKDIDDNYHIRIVEPGREDHGLCGNIPK
jgi:hypothetical protein